MADSRQIRNFFLWYLVLTTTWFLTAPYLVSDLAVENACRLLAQTSLFVIHWFDGSVQLMDRVLVGSSGTGFKVTEECTAFDYCAMIGVAALAYPADLRSRLVAAAGLVLALQVVNIARLVSIYFVMQLIPEHFQWIHENLWPLVFSIAGISLFVCWTQVIPRNCEAPG